MNGRIVVQGRPNLYFTVDQVGNSNMVQVACFTEHTGAWVASACINEAKIWEWTKEQTRW